MWVFRNLGGRTMNWPWVPRLAYEGVVADRDRLLAQNKELLDHITRMDRVEHGMTEVPRQQRPPTEPIDKELLAFINSHGSPEIRNQMLEEALRRHHKHGVPYSEIKRDVMGDENAGEQ